MFGISMTEIAAVAVVALLIVGPHKLPGMLRSLGQWLRKLHVFATDMRAQTGIDQILREEGIEGGITELRSLLRGDLRGLAAAGRTAQPAADDPYAHPDVVDRYREYPPEGVDAGGALPDDLVDEAALRQLERDEPGGLAG